MAEGLRSSLAVALSFALSFSSFAQQGAAPITPTADSQSVRIKTNEVLLDVVVNDRKGKPIRDLKAEEIEVYEDGVKQSIAQFKLVGGALPGEKNAPKSQPLEPTTNSATPLAANANTTPLNVVTLLFDHLPVSRVMPVREAALYFVDNSVSPDMLVRVMVVGQRLYLIEQFTNDRAKLRKAVERAVSTVEKSFADQSDRLAGELTKVVETANQQATQTPGQTETVAAQLARFSLDTLNAASKMANETRSKYHVFSLLPFARMHRALPGRKMALYFSDGLYQPPSLDEVTRSTISEANRANLSFYAINVRTLLAGIGGQSSRLETSTVVNQTRRPETATFNGGNANSFAVSDRYANRSQITTNFNMFEVFDRNRELNKLGPLNELAEGTGGFQITQINELNGALKRIATELGHYYAVSYLPSKQEYDGKFRAITVKVTRLGAVAQTRSGYFALPPVTASNNKTAANTRPVLTYEAPLLTALESATVPHAFPFTTATLHFEARHNSEIHEAVLVEAPFSSLIHTLDPQKKAYPAAFSVLALIKDEKGEVVQRFSEPHEMEIPEAMIEAVKKSNYTLTRHFWLPPGRYTLETAIHNEKSQQLSAQRQVFTVGRPTAGVQTSSLFIVKQVEPLDPNNTDPENPLNAQDKRLIPDLTESIAVKERPEIAFHLAIFPTKAATKPSVKLELLQSGQSVAATSPALPEADANGVIHFTASVNATNFYAGSYQFRATVAQGELTSSETVEFKVASDRQPSNAPEEKVIASALSVKDKAGELALISLKESKPIEVSINELLQEIEKSSVKMFPRLGEYTYSLRKVRRVLNPKGQIRSEDYQDYEAYPVKGRHALIRLSENGTRLTPKRLDIERKVATEELIKSEEQTQKLAENEDAELAKKIGYWSASFDGTVQKRGQPRHNVFVTIDPEILLRNCKFSAPRSVLLEGRETIVLDFKPGPKAALTRDKEWITQIEGSIWIDVAENSLIRIEGQLPGGAPTTTPANAETPLNFVYQQQRLAPGVWAPSLIRINAAGNEDLFQGLNWDAWFEFSNYKRFDTRDSDIKLNAPAEKTKGN